jgi:hypothetical protein
VFMHVNAEAALALLKSPRHDINELEDSLDKPNCDVIGHAPGGRFAFRSIFACR